MRRDVRSIVVISVAAVALATAITATLVSRNDYDTDPSTFTRTADPRQIVLTTTVGIGDEIIGRSVVEDAATVMISLRVRRSVTDKPALGVTVPFPVTLKAPLGNRSVLDREGRIVPEHLAQ